MSDDPATITRKRRNPKWGSGGGISAGWKDSNGLHEKLAIYCGENNLRISDVYSDIIRKYLKAHNVKL